MAQVWVGLLRIMAEQVRQSRRKDTLRLVNVFRKVLREQAIRAEMVNAVTRSSRTASTTMKPALQITQAACTWLDLMMLPSRFLSVVMCPV